jgi:predicted nucleic acid-binding protein
MPKPDEIVINTSPLIALVAALGDLSLLETLYTSVWVPFEVCQEILTGDSTRFAAAEFQAAEKLNKQTTPLEISSFLLNSLDLGEASVIQYSKIIQSPFV